MRRLTAATPPRPACTRHSAGILTEPQGYVTGCEPCREAVRRGKMERKRMEAMLTMSALATLKEMTSGERPAA